VGELALPASFVKAYRNVFEYCPRLPHESLSAEYSKAQAFIFNALADGFGHVVAESMACGTPVLASRNCGAPDLIGDGVEGRLVDYGDDQALGSVLDWALSHPAELAEMGIRARTCAQARSWDLFAERFLNWTSSVIRASISGMPDKLPSGHVGGVPFALPRRSPT
jgi:glycosyltransferase involved in cell wall biosynthesis